MIDAEHRSEERFAKLSIGYSTDEEKQKVNTCIEEVISKYSKSIQPETYTCCTSDGCREILVIEYQDDTNRESGPIFEEIIKKLDIKTCD